MKKDDLTYAIDFGTSNTLLGCATPLGKVKSVPIDFESDDPSIMKSLIYTPQEYEWYFGEMAQKKYLENKGQGRFFRSFKSLLPRKSFVGTMVHGQMTSAEELVGRFLRNVRTRGNEFYQMDVDKVVLGRPVLFSQDPDENTLAESRLIKAAEMAGFKEISLQYEPVAALNEFKHLLDREKLVLMVDLGGGTSDFSVMKMGGKEFDAKDLLGIGGVNLAGDAFDYSLMKDKVMPFLGSQIKYRRPGLNMDQGFPRTLQNKMCSPALMSLLQDHDVSHFVEEALEFIDCDESIGYLNNLENLFLEKAGSKLLKAIEKSKIEFSEQEKSDFEFIYEGIDIRTHFSRKEFIEKSQHIKDEIFLNLDNTLKNAQVDSSDIDLICCTGGTSKLGQINKALIETFGQAKILRNQDFHSVVGGLTELAFNRAG